MKPVRPLVAVLLAAAVTILLPATAHGITLTRHVVVPHGVTHKADEHRVVVTTVPPSDRDDDGYADSDDGCPDTQYLGNGGCPPPPPPPEPVASVATTSTSYATDGSCGGITPYYGAGQCWAIPYEIVSCESGGSLTAENPSGAYGAYQLLGHGEYEGMSKSEQDAMAAEVWAGGAGRDAWVC